ncbi:MAG: hypothetical protein ACK5LC_08245 [Coprobacillaceae bacterium]
MIKRIKTGVFNRRISIKIPDKKGVNLTRDVMAESNQFESSISEFNLKINKEQVVTEKNIKVDNFISKLDKLADKAQENECEQETSVSNISVDTLKNGDSLKAVEIESSLLQKYQKFGYSEFEAQLIIDLQKMNKDIILIEDLINNEVEVEFVIAQLFNETVLEALYDNQIQYQTAALIHCNLVEEEKINNTVLVLSNIKNNIKQYASKDLKAMDLYYEKHIIQFNESNSKEESVEYSTINHQLKILSNSLDQPIAESNSLLKSQSSSKENINKVVKNILDQVDVEPQLYVEPTNKYLNKLSLLVLKESKTIIEKAASNVVELKYSSELEVLETENMIELLDKIKNEIDKYGLDDFTVEYIQQKYIQAGLTSIDAELLIDLQEKNFDKLDLKTVVENKIPSAYIKNLWFNEIINELLFKFNVEDQTMMLIRHNLIDDFKLMDTQILLDNILFNKTDISEFDLRKMDLYFEDELVEMKNATVVLKEQYYSKIHDQLNLMRKASQVERNTLESVGQLYNVTRERIRQVDQKMCTRLSMLSKQHQTHLNKDFLLGLNSLSLSLLGHKPIKAIEYFLDGIVTPTKYFVDEYKLDEEYYIYNNKVIAQNNKALFDMYMTEYNNREHSAQEILEDFLETLKDNDIYEKVMKRDVVDLREIQGRLARMDDVIHAGQYYRKHTIKTTELEELVEAIENVELPSVFSTQLLINMGLINNLDIKDENELHNILKKNNNLFNININFTRMPHIILGNSDMVEELYQLVDIELLATDTNKALKELSEITGMKENTLSGSYVQKILNLASKQELNIPNLESLEQKLYSLDIDVVHLNVLEEKHDIVLPSNLKDILKVRSVSGYKLRSNWLLKECYKSISDFIETNTDEYGIFNESQLGASRYVHNYTTMKKSLRAKNIYRLNSNELYCINDESLVSRLEDLKSDVLYNFEYPYSLEALLETNELSELLEKNELDMYGFSSMFIEDVILSIEELSLDGSILINKNEPIEYSRYLEGFVCSVFDYEEEFLKEIGCEPPAKYIRKLEEEGIFVKDAVLYLEKEIYLNELRSVA